MKSIKEIVLITGANGLLAKNLADILANKYSVRFLSRNAKNKNEFRWDIDKNYIDPKAFEGVKHIIHLAGASVADKPWTKKRKVEIIKSRVESAVLIKTELVKQGILINTFISASAVGFYGTATTKKIYTEKSSKGNDFLSEVCSKWESVVESFKKDKITDRLTIIRIGVILAKNGGALEKIIQPIKYGFGAAVGEGSQWMPWIHIFDLSNMILFLLENKNTNGVFNGVAPNHVTNKELTLKIAKFLEKKIWLPNIPEFVIKLMFGKRALILLKGSRVSSEKIMKSGFTYRFETIEKALKNLLSEK